MPPLLSATIIFSGIMIVSIIGKSFKWKNWWIYVFAFLALWWSQWFFSSKANADEGTYPPYNREQIILFWENSIHCKALSNKTRAIYRSNADWHTQKAYEEFNAAKDKCFYLPNLKDREKAKNAFALFVSIAVPNTPLYKAIAILTTILLDYGCACIDEWYDIKELLESAQYNADMAKLYQDLLSKD